MEPPPDSKATSLNKRVMEMLEEALEENPEIDILSVIPPGYKSSISQARPPDSHIIRLNQRMLRKLESRFRKNPEINFSWTFQDFYRREWDRLTDDLDPTTQERLSKREIPEASVAPHTPASTLERLKDVDEAVIVSHLSSTVTALLEQATDLVLPDLESGKMLAEKLKITFRSSKILHELPVGGAVFRCGDEIVAKVMARGLKDSTEYTSMQHLAKNAPNIPAPKPHGLIYLGHYQVIFMSYIPSKTLEEVWPSMMHDQKISIQHQLDDIFRRLRQLKQPDGLPLGGVEMEGAKDQHRFGYKSDRAITTFADFDNWKFTFSGFSTEYYINFLRGFLPPSTAESVFTHGDLRPANIMVDMVESGLFSVTGIIDWEESGFYPDYHESTKVTNLLQSNVTSDWYQYLPPCIAPHTFPVRWLIDRLWDRNILYAH